MSTPVRGATPDFSERAQRMSAVLTAQSRTEEAGASFSTSAVARTRRGTSAAHATVAVLRRLPRAAVALLKMVFTSYVPEGTISDVTPDTTRPGGRRL